MASDATWLAAVVWIFIALFVIYVVFYISQRGEYLQDREFIEQQLLEQARALKATRNNGLQNMFPRRRLLEKLKTQYEGRDPIEFARLLESDEYLRKVANNENPMSQFLPYYAPEQLRDELKVDFPGVPLQDALSQKLAQLDAMAL